MPSPAQHAGPAADGVLMAITQTLEPEHPPSPARPAFGSSAAHPKPAGVGSHVGVHRVPDGARGMSVGRVLRTRTGSASLGLGGLASSPAG